MSAKSIFNFERFLLFGRKKSPLMSMLNASLLSSLITTTILTLILIFYWSEGLKTTISGLDIFITIITASLGMLIGFVVTLPLLLMSYFIMIILLRKRKNALIYWFLCSLIIVLPFVDFPLELKSKSEILENPINAYLSMLLLPTAILTGVLSWWSLKSFDLLVKVKGDIKNN